MKVVCINEYRIKNYKCDPNGEERTTIGKTYELFQYKDSYGDIGYYFIADNGDSYGDKPIYFEKYFISLEQHREQQLNSIGI